MTDTKLEISQPPGKACTLLSGVSVDAAVAVSSTGCMYRVVLGNAAACEAHIHMTPQRIVALQQIFAEQLGKLELAQALHAQEASSPASIGLTTRCTISGPLLRAALSCNAMDLNPVHVTMASFQAEYEAVRGEKDDQEDEVICCKAKSCSIHTDVSDVHFYLDAHSPCVKLCQHPQGGSVVVSGHSKQPFRVTITNEGFAAVSHMWATASAYAVLPEDMASCSGDPAPRRDLFVELRSFDVCLTNYNQWPPLSLFNVTRAALSIPCIQWCDGDCTGAVQKQCRSTLFQSLFCFDMLPAHVGLFVYLGMTLPHSGMAMVCVRNFLLVCIFPSLVCGPVRGLLLFSACVYIYPFGMWAC